MRPASLTSAALALALASCSRAPTAPPKAPPPAFTFETKLDRDAPLVGRIWDVARATFTDDAVVAAAAARAHFVLLGEKHDNPDHHRLQARVLGDVVRSGRKPALALEMIDDDAQPALDRFLAGPSPTPAALGAAVQWSQSGWPPWPEYEPIAKVALAAGLPIVAANLPRAKVHALVHAGASALEPGVFEKLGLSKPLAAEQEAALEQEMRDSHCGMLPERAVAPMALAQRARDAAMAAKMIEADRGQGSVLIAGAGHVRADRGVPMYLAAQRPGQGVLTIAFAEVDRDTPDPRAYGARYGDKGALPFDYVWFTPRANDDDPCEGMRK